MAKRLLIDGSMVVLALAMAGLMLVEPPLRGWPAQIVLVLLAGWIAVVDWRTQTIADGASLALAAVGGALRLLTADGTLLSPLDLLWVAVLEAAFAFALMWLVREIWYRRHGFDGLGLGDVKLGAAGAFMLGGEGFAMALLAASLAGLLVFAALRWRRGPEALAARLAFGSLLAPAIVGAELLGHLPAGFGLGGQA